jgi:type IV pilus assembly protein PilC
MAEFNWQALNSQGAVIKGRSIAESESELIEALDANGLLLMRAHKNRTAFLNNKAKVGKLELATMTFQLAMMIKAGVPLMDSLKDLASTEKNVPLRQVLTSLVDSLVQGQTFSQALADHPRVFGEVYIQLVRAGEQTGRLQEVLEQLTETLRWENETASQVKKAMIYPAVVIVVVMVVFFFLLYYLVPQIASLLRSLNVELPWYTLALLWLSGFVERNVWTIVISMVTLFVVAPFVVRVPASLRPQFDRLLLRMPIMGGIMWQMALARFAYVLAEMYAAGITVIEALKVAENVVGNVAIANVIGHAREQIAAGRSLSQSFADSDLIPPLVVSMLRVGEQTGDLDSTLNNVRYIYTRQAKESVDKLQILLQPVMVVVLGLILAGVMVATLGPIYTSVFSNIK